MLILMLPAAFFIGWLIYALLPTIILKYAKTYTLPISNTGEKRLLLTFDDGPDPRYTYRVLAILKKYNIKAIFFLPAFKALRYPGIADSIRRDGHMIGCHGHAHRNPLFQWPWTTKKDFQQSSLVWEELGYSPQFYRPPHGCLNLSSLAACRRYGYRLLLWNTIVGDWRNTGKDIILERLMGNLRPGNIILLHDSGEDTGGEPGAPEGTIEALAEFIPRAMERGYSFISPEEYLNEP